MNNKKKRFTENHLLVILTIICISIMALTAYDVVSVSPVKEAASVLIVPFQKGINSLGTLLGGLFDGFRDSKELSERVSELEDKVAELEEENLLLREDSKALERFKLLYDTDAGYSQYEKVEANIIAKDAGNWYFNFTIDKGSDEGIEVDMNVISSGGLVGLVTEVGRGWANVKSIIDDTSSVSAMTVTTEDSLIVSGDLTLIDDGKLYFDQLNTDEEILPGEIIVTSYISDKYLPGIEIGSIYEIENDPNNLTKKGYILPSVDFSSLREVLVIKELKTSPQNQN